MPIGKFAYQGKVIPTLFKKSKIFKHDDPEEAKIIMSLKAKGYLCMRRSMIETGCQYKTTSFELPSNTSEKARKVLANYLIKFPETPDIEFSHNGSSTKEWLIRGEYSIGDTPLNIYRMTLTNEGLIYFAFPVTDENPISFLTYHDDKSLGFTLGLQGKDSEGWKLNYQFEAIYEPISN